jgi:hypothetical protein
MIKQVWRAKQNRGDHWQNIQGYLQGCRKTLQVWVRK